MGKTIKEMAEDKYSAYEDAWMHKAYIEGANAVIQEIEKITNAVLKGSNWPEYAFDEIVEKIKQLKGE